MLLHDDRLRAMYAGGRGDATARRFARFWAAVFGAGLVPRRWVTLEVAGRRTGRVTRFPLGMARWQDRWFLVPMLGGDCNWVRNVRAAGGRAVIRHRRARPCTLTEIPPADRAPILRSFLHQVPGARPHVPVDRDAPLDAFTAISDRYPAFRVDFDNDAHRAGAGHDDGRVRPRARHRLRWFAAIAVVTVLGLLGAAAAAVALQPSPAALTLPAAGPPASGSPAGHWRITAGSVAGFRVEQTFLGVTSEVTGRAEGVTGTMTVTGDRIDTAEARIDLLTLTSDGREPAPQFAASLETARFPEATVRLTGPIPLGSTPGTATGTVVTATGELTLHGVTRTVTTTLSVRRDAEGLAIAGAVPVRFADWDIRTPTGYGVLGSLADHGIAEFLLILRNDGP
ncbi:nitroreductase/quinone reductase family protein [Actinoplanes subglobosus]|uniref:Nitroreductase/quinone reductase family protein n=1 Tax=Actinoplanes subglobosus TaxID=1547892 RepID=A0ABV8J6S9_9ACTN